MVPREARIRPSHAAARGQQGRRPRRRGEVLEGEILQATLDELAEVGYARLTIEGVAARVRTGRTVLYRRWRGRAELVMAALRRHRPLLSREAPDTGSLREDVLALLRRYREGLDGIGRDTLYGLAAEYFLDDDAFPIFRRGVEAGREAMTAILWRASQRGEVEIARLTPMVVSLPVDLLRHELLFVAEGDVGEERLRQIVDDVFLPLVRA